MTCSHPTLVRNMMNSWPLVCMAAFALAMAPGCLTPNSGGGGGGGGTENDNATATQGSIDNILSGTPVMLSANQSFSVLYSTPVGATSVSSFYVRVADPSVGSQELEPRVIFAQNLPAGPSQYVDFDTTGLTVGYYRIGITYTDLGVVATVTSNGVVDLQGSPNPMFIEPDDDVTLDDDSTEFVTVSFDCMDPENLNVRWRLFFDTKDTIDQYAADPSTITDIRQVGNQLATGSSNVGTYSWFVFGLLPGNYAVGVSATDSGTSIEGTDDEERIFTTFSTVAVTIVEPTPPPKPPTITVTAPSNDITVYPGTDVAVNWNAQQFEGPADAPVSVFYDQDGVLDGDEIYLEQGVDTSQTVTTLDTSTLDDGTYRVGVIVDDGLNDPVHDYANGVITVDGVVTFEVNQPATDRNVPPNEPVSVSWTTNVPADLREFEAYAQSDPNGDGTMLGPQITLLSASDSTSVDFDTTGLSGLYLITVEMTVTGETDPRTMTAPGKVRVSTSPQIFWLGELEEAVASGSRGAILQGVNFEDNAGSSFSPVGDLDGDGTNEFLVAARYGKPFFNNFEGIGHGEAYLIYGSNQRFSGALSLNSVGTTGLRGVTFSGIRTPASNSETDGLADVIAIPDVDGDSREELIFGFPNVDSRGHNLDPEQDGVQPEDSLGTLELHDQFLRGGIVIVSSLNSILSDPTDGPPSILLDMVGQAFPNVSVTRDETVDVLVPIDIYDAEQNCDGGCYILDQLPDGVNDAFDDRCSWLEEGFHSALAPTYLERLEDHFDPFDPCAFSSTLDHFCCETFPVCAPTSPGLHWFPVNGVPQERGVHRSGFYPFVGNDPLEPFGARIIGVGLEDGFGTSFSLTNALGVGTGEILVSAPNRTAIGLLKQTKVGGEQGPEDGGLDYKQGGEIAGLDNGSGDYTNDDSGVAYLFELRSLWTDDFDGDVPPKPHQYIVGEGSHCGRSGLIDNVDALRVAGNTDQRIRNIVGINDFNGDGRNDFAIGSPGGDPPDDCPKGGTLHITFRREGSIEEDFVLSKIELDPADPERLQGAFITGDSCDTNFGEGFGASMATGIDFNGDGLDDLVVSTPNHDQATGAIDIILTDPSLVTPEGGISIDDLREDQRRAVRIVGFEVGDRFGYNVANAGDLDGDSLDDLLVSAPGATPHFDENPDDNIDELTTPGLDLDFDGVADDINGDEAANDTLTDAGLVYVILGKNVLGGDGFFDQDRYPNGIVDIRKLGTSDLLGAIIVGRRAGDQLGGGDAGDETNGGIDAKEGRGRSFGLKGAGDVDGDGLTDVLIGAILADVIDPVGGSTKTNAGEAYILYGFEP